MQFSQRPDHATDLIHEVAAQRLAVGKFFDDRFLVTGKDALDARRVAGAGWSRSQPRW